MVEISICGSCEFESAETDIVKGLVIDTVSLIGVLNKLMDRKGCVVGLDNGIRDLEKFIFFQIMINLSEWCYRFTRAYYLRRRDNGECVHHTVWVFFTNFRN